MHDEKVAIRHGAESAWFPHKLNEWMLLAANPDGMNNWHFFCFNDKSISVWRSMKIKIPLTKGPGI